VLQTDQAAKYYCEECGADRFCDCNAPAVEKAAKAIKANPGMSNRAIAKEAGVSAPTVAKARRATVNGFTVDEPRIGLDGRTRKMPRRPFAHAAAPYPRRFSTNDGWERTKLEVDANGQTWVEQRPEEIEDLPVDDLEALKRGIDLADRGQFIVRANLAKRFAVYSGPVGKQELEFVNDAARAWNKLRSLMKGRVKGKVGARR
jgi:hypothetical protein